MDSGTKLICMGHDIVSSTIMGINPHEFVCERPNRNLSSFRRMRLYQKNSFFFFLLNEQNFEFGT